MSTRRLGGLQKQVLSLYREVLRAARHKPADARTGIEALARSEFELWRGLHRSEINRIEHLIRRGKRQAAMLSQSDVQGIGTVKGKPAAAPTPQQATGTGPG